MKNKSLQEHFEYQRQIMPDGSSRIFLKGIYNGKPALLIKPGASPGGAKEGYAYAMIGRHLHANKLPVPEIYDFDPETGDVLAQFIEGEHLEVKIKQYVSASTSSHDKESAIQKHYEAILSTLLKMQTQGIQGFDTTWCFDTPYYDSKLAFEREAMYFVNSFLKDLCNITVEQGILAELRAFCSHVDRMQHFLLHRDFQSRNILVKGDMFWFLDFQGMRLGPLGYDLASLLYDPYVDLSPDLRAYLLDFYCLKLKNRIPTTSIEAFTAEFKRLSILRLLQATGAYSFLSSKKGKPFFKQFIPVALKNLRQLISQLPSELTSLKKLIASLHNK